MIPFVRDFDPEYGVCRRVSPRIRRVVANNPGPFTYTGTGTYIVGNGTVAVIDPGPEDAAHLEALLAAVGDETVSHVLVTHTHRDHAPLARPFADAVGALVLAARPPARETHASGALDEAEDQTFRPDVILGDGDRIAGPDWTLETLATPGHASNHLAFALIEENALFSGDHVMGWATSVVAPPDGDMGAYMDSLERVTARGFAALWPTHGAPVTDVAPFLTAYKAHRLEREAQIVARLEAGDRTISAMVPGLYAAVDQRLWPAAALSVLAHLIDLVRRGLVVCKGEPELGSVFRLRS
ncbi:MBL fold metallo-hydrolase [Brevundimonas sp.]|uniref:MBL fold metallo-hydrolase n=1 Tax=Brevundimonas sp. TaxID=1871086 RepID=UPI001D3936F6|nr:MBL fold metallo-hydrolase [Brevundimonas sp.]MBA4000108.1 MBL fold metallo-hydrolase [Brevundimonas sp.]